MIEFVGLASVLGVGGWLRVLILDGFRAGSSLDSG